MSENIVSGAGLVGSLLAIILKKKGLDVEVFEKRPDMRLESVDSGRSINLIVTSRGIHALKEVGLWDKVKTICAPVTGRMMHSLTGELTYQPYGKDDSECNYSVSRTELNKLLMNEAEANGVNINFSAVLEEINFPQNNLQFKDCDDVSYDVEFSRVFGTDGAGSVARKSIMKAHGSDATESMEPLGADYKELFMPAKANGEYAIEKKALHIWPRGAHMLMALPNLDGSFTMTLYMPAKNSEVCFEKIKTEDDVQKLFETYYADAIELMPNYKKEFIENNQGFLGTVRCKPWNFKGEAVLLGDAAHAVVPFFGQGMNCGFEDCSVLSKQIDEHKDSWETAFSAYNEYQKPNGDAIADMAIENFVEMADKVGDENFLLKKKIDGTLEKEFPTLYRTRYAMVVYTLISYSLAQKAGLIQKEILEELAKNLNSIEQLDLAKAKSLIDQKFTPFIKENNINLERYLG